MTLTPLFLGLIGSGVLLMLLVLILDDFLDALFDGAAPVIAVGLAAAGITGFIVTRAASLPRWPAIGLALAAALVAGALTRAGWRALRRRGPQVLAPLEASELVAAPATVLWWRDGRGKVLIEAPRGGQHQLVASGDEALQAGQSVTVVDAGRDEHGAINVVVSRLALAGE